MQPEYLIARPHSFLQAASCVELCDFSRPSVSALDAGNERLADVKLGSDILLHPPFSYRRKHRCVAAIQGIHTLPLAANDAERQIGLLCFDVEVGPNGKQEPLYVGRGRNGVAEQAPIVLVSGPSVFFNSAVSEPLMHGVQGRAKRIRKPQSNPTLVFVDLDAAFPVKEASNVTEECVFAEIVHPYSLARRRVAKKRKVAVPVMHWIGQRIDRVEVLASIREAA